MADDLAMRIRQYYDTAAPPVDAEEALERHSAPVGEGPALKRIPGWFGRHTAAAVGAAAVATLLLVGGALWAVSSDPARSTPVAPIVEVNGESTCRTHTLGKWTGDTLTGGFSAHQRGHTNVCATEASDARVSGSWDIAISCDYSLEGDVIVGQCWGTMEMEGANGGWVGTWIARTESPTDNPDHIFHIVDADAVGWGEYAGLRFVHRYEGFDLWTVTGQIGLSTTAGS